MMPVRLEPATPRSLVRHSTNEPLSALFSFKLIFSKISFRNIIVVSNSLDSEKDGHSVGPDLGPNCMQRLSADDKSHSLLARKELIYNQLHIHAHGLVLVN